MDDAERDTKPFLPLITATAIHPGIQHGHPGACQAAMAPSEHGAARGAVMAQPQPQPQPQPACVLNQAASELSEGGGGGRSCTGQPHEGTPARHPCSAAPRMSRKFWSAGEYDGAADGSAQQPQSVQNRMCVHPKFLHSNATSHKWPFGAMAELLDNAVDEIRTGGATKILVDKVIDNRNGSPALLVQDDGGGMDPNSMRRCMSFGFSDKQSGSSIGQYGNGFKTSTMRLGADVIVFSRSMRSGEPTQSIGLLSYTFLAETGQNDVVVPVVDYKCNLFTGQTTRFERHGSDQFSSNLSVLLKWSPFATEEELMQNFSDIGPHGTKIIVFNLWSNDDGTLELDFDTNPEDIMINGAANPETISNSAKRANESHLANQLRYSLRVYTSVLYLQLPEYFKITLRGQEVKRHCIAADLIYPECISYKPQTWGRKESEVLTSIGFLRGSPTISVHGFNIYHKNRLILPFHRVLSSASSKGRGVAGVLEADFMKPTHDKQDFEKSQLFQRLINRLKDMTSEYWDLYSHKVGYVKPPRARAPPAPLEMVPTASAAAAEPPEVLAPAPLAVSAPDAVSAIPIAFAPGARPMPSGAPQQGAPGTSRQPSWAAMAPGADAPVEARKRKADDGDGPAAAAAASSKRQARHDSVGINSAASDHPGRQRIGERELKEYRFLKLENGMLREEIAQFETAEKELLLKEQDLRAEIARAQAQYQGLLNQYVSLPAAAPAPQQAR